MLHRLPLPWLLWSIINKETFQVTSSGLFCSTIMLFVMLLIVVISIAVCKWKMSKALGISMLVLYLSFVVLSVLLQKSVIECPIWFEYQRLRNREKLYICIYVFKRGWIMRVLFGWQLYRKMKVTCSLAHWTRIPSVKRTLYFFLIFKKK